MRLRMRHAVAREEGLFVFVAIRYASPEGSPHRFSWRQRRSGDAAAFRANLREAATSGVAKFSRWDHCRGHASQAQESCYQAQDH